MGSIPTLGTNEIRLLTDLSTVTAVIRSGLIAGIAWIVLGSVVTASLGRDFAAIPENRLGAPSAGFVSLNVAIDLVEGISILWLYAAIRPRYGAGPKTAFIASLAW